MDGAPLSGAATHRVLEHTADTGFPTDRAATVKAVTWHQLRVEVAEEGVLIRVFVGIQVI